MIYAFVDTNLCTTFYWNLFKFGPSVVYKVAGEWRVRLKILPPPQPLVQFVIRPLEVESFTWLLFYIQPSIPSTLSTPSTCWRPIWPRTLRRSWIGSLTSNSVSLTRPTLNRRGRNWLVCTLNLFETKILGYWSNVSLNQSTIDDSFKILQFHNSNTTCHQTFFPTTDD